ncbi:MAG: glycosyltransferase [Gracilibacteraceae bacterium]|nr:glycosyltransferase [Gracilibacteraceae bacterium]
MPKLSFVIPCYGSELTIERVIAEIGLVATQKPEYDYEIICVNDSSPDNVLPLLRRLAASDPRLTVVDLSRNMGKHSAVMAGYSLATGDIIINLDDDGQSPMPHLWELLLPLSEGYDISMAKYPRKMQSRFKNFASRINAEMAHLLLGKPRSLAFENFSAVKRFVIDEVLKYQNPYPYLDGLYLRSTGKIANVVMEQRERSDGRGGFTFLKSLKLWLNGFTAFSVKPLRISTFLGAAVALAGFIYGLWIIIRKLFLVPEMSTGYPSIMSALLFIGGMIMMMLGMLGEYVGRIYISINKSPQYVIREIIHGGAQIEDN